jgi:hypothetical protein
MNIKEKTLCILLAECCQHHNVLCMPEDVTIDDSQKEALGIKSSREKGVHTSKSWSTS